MQQKNLNEWYWQEKYYDEWKNELHNLMISFYILTTNYVN